MNRLLLKIASSVAFWRIMCFVMATGAFCIYFTRPRIVIETKREIIYLLLESPSDEGTTESRFI